MDALEFRDTQTQEDYIESSQNIEIEIRKPWGRLSTCLSALESIDLYEPSYTLGRAEECKIFVNKSYFPSILNISKQHFVLERNDDIAYITDLSKNGTFLNNIKIGKNNKHIINNDDIIAIGHPSVKVYTFASNLNYDDNNYPDEMRNKYFISKKIGSGAFGEVRLAHDKRTFQKFAIKRINKLRSSLSSVGRASGPEKIKTEISILTTLSYPHIIQMIEVFETDREVFLVLEYMHGGELTSRISSSNPLPEAEAKFIFYQILLAVRYLHLNGVTHRDLKPENILLFSNNEYPLIKVSDFGLSKIMDDISLMETVCGTVSYAAPEVINCCYDRYNKNVDVWSLGVVLFCMLSKTQPFPGENKEEIGKKIISGKINWNSKSWGGISSQAKDLVQRMLTVKPEKRITLAEIIKHEWIERDCRMKYKVEQFSMPTFEETDSSEELISSPKRLRLSIE